MGVVWLKYLDWVAVVAIIAAKNVGRVQIPNEKLL